jgi:hypothetical protein
MARETDALTKEKPASRAGGAGEDARIPPRYERGIIMTKEGVRSFFMRDL